MCETRPDRTAKDYKTAAKRHIATCKNILWFLENTKKSEDLKKQQLLQNVYYLSGYAIECIACYGFMTLMPEKPIVESLAKRKKAIHNFQHNLIAPLESHPHFELHQLKSESLLDGDKQQLDNLYQFWNTPYRYDDMYDTYENGKLWTESVFVGGIVRQEKSIRNFFKLSENIYYKIINLAAGQ